MQAAAEAGAVIEWLLISEASEPEGWPDDLIETLTPKARRVDRITEAEMKGICASVTPPGLAALLSWRAVDGDVLIGDLASVQGTGDRSRMVVVADAVTDPGNMGTIIRTADWFGAEAVIAGIGSVDVTNPKVVQSTMGSLFQQPVSAGQPVGSTLERLQGAGYSVASLELDGATDIREIDWPDDVVLVVGNEAHGVSEEASRLADFRVRIPRFGRVESLNAAASVAVILGHLRLSRKP